MKAPSLLGAILVGGRGTRFGGPKAAAPVGGVPMVERVAGAVRQVATRTILVGAGPVPDLGMETIPDRIPGAGPLAGLEAALAEAEGAGMDAVLLVACDLPLVDAQLLARIARELGDGPAVAAAREGGVETACAAYSVRVLSAVRAALASEDRSLHGLFRAVGGRALEPELLGLEPGRQLLNVNAPEDRDRAELLLAGP